MKRLLLLSVLGVVGALGGYFVMRGALRLPMEPLTAEARLDWLAREFGLDVAQRAEVARLEAAYAPVCAAHCEAIAGAEAALVRAAGEDERAAARAELARLERVCADATRAHLESVAALMQPEHARRFLALMEPRVAHHPGRTGAPSLGEKP